MREHEERIFPLVDAYAAIRLEIDAALLTPGRTIVIESPRRLRREQRYGNIGALWWVWLPDGRSAVGVPPGTREAVVAIVADVRSGDQIVNPRVAEKLREPVNAALREAGLQATDRVFSDVRFACNASLLRRHSCGGCRRLVDDSVPPAEGLGLPSHCFPDGIVYGVVVDGVVASVAFAHRTGVMEDRVADLGVVTAPAYRGRGYAKTVVSAVVEHITRAGGEALYVCRPDNYPSRAVARSVGFVPYGTSLVLAAPCRTSDLVRR